MSANRLMVLAGVSALGIAAVLVAFGQSNLATTSAPAGTGQDIIHCLLTDPPA
jgi:hypothetical protein